MLEPVGLELKAAAPWAFLDPHPTSRPTSRPMLWFPHHCNSGRGFERTVGSPCFRDGAAETWGTLPARGP